jgi:ammonia channel protein AmtB
VGYAPVAHWVWGSGGWLAGRYDRFCRRQLAVFALPAFGVSNYRHEMSVANQLGAQAIGVAAAAAWSALCTYLLVKLLDATVGARVSLEEGRNGLELVSPAA